MFAFAEGEGTLTIFWQRSGKFYSRRLTGAALDRLTHRCHILETMGESYRLKDAQRRRRKKTKE